MSIQRGLIAHLLDAFPPRAFEGDITRGACAAMDEDLRGKTWWAVSKRFAQEHAGRLSLLSEAAYRAFLPAWLSEAALDPDGELAGQVLDNLKQGGMAGAYSSQERYAVVYIANQICGQRHGDGEEGQAIMAGITRKWGAHGA